MLNRDTWPAEDVSDSTPLSSGPSKLRPPEVNKQRMAASSESEGIMGAVPWHSGRGCECLQLDVLLSRR